MDVARGYGPKTCSLACFFVPEVSRAPPRVVYLLPSLRARTAKTLICRKSGVSADPRKSAKKCGKPRFLRKKCAKKCVKSAVFRPFWRSFWDRRKPHFFCRSRFWPFGLCSSAVNTQPKDSDRGTKRSWRFYWGGGVLRGRLWG